MPKLRRISIAVSSFWLAIFLLAGAVSSLTRAGPSDTGSELFADQGWTASERHEFYFTSQGSQLMPYAWVHALERPGGGDPFLDPKLGLSRFGYLNDPSGDRTLNPDGLPIGFVKDSPSKTGADCEYVGMTCAACHTGRFELAGNSLFIDGAPASADMWAFIAELRDSLHLTAQDTGRLAAFSAKLPQQERDGGSCVTDRGHERLAQSLQFVSDHLGELLAPQGDETASKRWGPARLDAVGMITNQILVHVMPGQPLVPVNAPVSYPFIWDVHTQTQVQWNGVSTLPLTRNIVEVMGVFAEYGPELQGWWPFKRYSSTVRVDGLRTLEDRVSTLRAPAWPEALLGSKIDLALAAQGKDLFEQNCASCHSHVARDESPPFKIGVDMTPIAKLRTDPAMAENFASPLDKRGERGMPDERIDCSKGPVKSPPMEGILGEESPRVVGGLIAFVLREIPELLRAAVPPVAAWDRCAYKAGPINGIWATAPYLHNGSVPNLDELLKPAQCADGEKPEACRVASFCVSIEPKFDAEKVGLPSDANSSSCAPDEVPFDTSLPGNSNSGHEYGRFDENQRKALIEYQKSL